MVLNIQSEIFENIKTLCTNYSKDSKSRKTQEYLTKRLVSLEDQWREFEENHQQLQKLPEKTHKYFVDNIYEKTRDLYNNTKTDILKMMLGTTSQESVPKLELAKEETDTKAKELLEEQECNFNALNHVMSKIRSDGSYEKWEWQEHLTILKSKWEKIDNLHWKLQRQLKGSNADYDRYYNTNESKYEDLKKIINNHLNTNIHFEQSTPTINVPQFSGDYNHWVTFKDLFVDVIDKNPTLTKTQKLQHLKGKLRGEAERLVQHLKITNENYDRCWAILTHRYDHERLIFSSYMESMIRLPVIQHPTTQNMKTMHDVMVECLNGLSGLGLDTEASGPIIVYFMSKKLDNNTYNRFITKMHNGRAIPEMGEFIEFLENSFIAQEGTRPSNEKPSNSSNYNKNPKPWNRQLSRFPRTIPRFQNDHPRTYHTTYTNCPLCNGSHVLMQCDKFIDMDIKGRNNAVAKLKVCNNCLYDHGNKMCNSSKTCKECNKPHHTLLHYSNFTRSANTGQSYDKNKYGERPSTSANLPSSNHLSGNDMVLLPTAQIRAKTVDGTFIKLRALLDQGSQVNLITENAAQLLKLPRKRLNATVSGVGAVSGECKGYLEIECKSIHSDYTLHCKTLIMKKLINSLPNTTFKRGNWPHIENLSLADPEFNVTHGIDLLLGAEVYSEILSDGVLRGEVESSPIAQQTRFGWILCGKLQTYNCHAVVINLEDISKFWETEDILQNSTDIPSDDECESYYKETTRRTKDGKYIVKMPMVLDFEQKLGKSKSIAVSQFLQSEKRLMRQRKLCDMYKEFIHEYLELGHMKPSASPSDVECFLPHHGVLREHADTTKLRVVFNASQKTTSGYTLNDLMKQGPNLQNDIQSLILRWKTYKYVLSADIEKFFRCIFISEEQQPLQKIIWRDSTYDRLTEMQLCTVTYGTKAAPWLAMRTLKQLTYDDGHKYPEAAKTIQRDVFVDDLIFGNNSFSKAQALQKSISDLLRGGGMNLRKWCSNEPKLLSNLSKDQVTTKNIFDFKDGESKKTLGLGWNPRADLFMFDWNLDWKQDQPLTKRFLLSEISKLYDPLGWLAPINLTAKLLFQKVWIHKKLEWDDTLPTNIQDEWIKLANELPIVKQIKLPRWIGETENHIELHGYCDASQNAFSCVIYSRTIRSNEASTINLLISKTRLVPISQKISLPKLELCGALLLSQVMKKVLENFTDYNATVYAWCDSKVTLAWIQGSTSRWEKYVANRVIKIRSVIPPTQWNYVKSELNPADCASRGLSPSKLINFTLWWQGPPDLKSNYGKYELKTSTTFETTEAIDNSLHITCIATTSNSDNFIETILNKYSSLTRVTRVMAWILRFITNTREKIKSELNYLSLSELKIANDELIKYTQHTSFAQECNDLLQNKLTSNKSVIYKLHPYLDEKKIIRVQGRLLNSHLSEEQKHPVIIPHSARFTSLLINDAHIKTLHAGARLTLAYIRQRYWIVGGNRAVKAALHHCVKCHRYKQSKNEQIMGNLPGYRVTPSRPFTHTGVDFTGHVDVKLNKGRGVTTSKGYIAVFICMVTKAVHIELVSDLSTETFLAAFQRLCARRGTPKHVYSDCGTNFVGAARVLSYEFELFKNLMSPDFFDEITKLEVEWHFNAPAWPNGGGGLWEAAVKSMKYHLRRVIGQQKLTYEEFSTLLTKIEACMNSRPLCPLTEDPEEFYNYLTPGHFLTGGPILNLPQADRSNIKGIDLRKRWQLTEHMFQQFWKSWSNEYLQQLQARTKWQKPMKNIKEGDIVLVKDDNLPPGKWAMARVLQLHPGKDGYVRVTTLKTQTNTIKRPIVKLSPLPIQTDISENSDTETRSCDKHTRSKNKPKRGVKYCLSLITTIITMFTLMTGAYGDQVAPRAQITTIETGRPVYYDTVGNLQFIHNEWIVLMYYNLTNYWKGTELITQYVESVTSLCEKIDPRYCKPNVDQLNHEIEILDYYNSILLMPHKHLSSRKKRGLINGVGNIANSLFGILDNQFAEKYSRDIEAIHNNENYLLELTRNQTSIIKVENDILKKGEENIAKQFTLINNLIEQTNSSLEKVQTEMELLTASIYFSTSSLSAFMMITGLKRVQEMLFNTLTDTYNGHIDVELLSPNNLAKQLDQIAGRLPKSLSLPVENKDIKELYKMMSVKARVTDTYFLFEIHIPLANDDNYKLHHVIPLPIWNKTNLTQFIEIKSDYLAVNFKKNTYLTLSTTEVRHCIKHGTQRNYMCLENIPVYNIQNEKAICEAKLLTHYNIFPCNVKQLPCKEDWIELHQPNTWLLLCCGHCTFRIICDDDVTLHTLQTSVILRLDQGCILQSNELTIHSRMNYNSDAQFDDHIFMPVLNNSINRLIDITLQMSYDNFTKNPLLHEMDRELADMKTREEKLPSTLSNDDIHQYVVIYVMLGLALLGAGVWSGKKLYALRVCPSHPPARDAITKKTQKQHVYEDIELQPVVRQRDASSAANCNAAFNFD